MIETLLSLTNRDVDTWKHSRRTSRYARLLAGALAKNPAFATYLTPERVELLSSLAPLHDIGKVGVPDAVLNKPGALTPEEMAEMQRHPVYGRDVICRAEQESGIVDTDLGMARRSSIPITKSGTVPDPEGLRGPTPGCRARDGCHRRVRCCTAPGYYDAMSHDAQSPLS